MSVVFMNNLRFDLPMTFQVYCLLLNNRANWEHILPNVYCRLTKLLKQSS